MSGIPSAIYNGIIALLVLLTAIVLGQLSWIGVKKEKKFEDCGHEEYTICNTESDWIDAYCNSCNARLLFSLTEVEPP